MLRLDEQSLIQGRIIVTRIEATLSNADLVSAINQPLPQNEVHFWWLGQAGFALKYYNNTLLLIDPYLSDSLAEKYRDKELRHRRMMPIPIAPERITGCSWYLCTHSHTDHMDPATIRGILRNNDPAFLVPRAEIARAVERGVPPDNLYAINAGETLQLTDHITVEAVASAHEQLTEDDRGNHKYLGYILSLDGLRLYHSGDTIPYPALKKCITEKNIEIALLPINGRDEYRASRGIPGNFTLEEAIQFCHAAHIPQLIGHHFEMFDFNTIERGQARAILQQQAGRLNWLLPEIGVTYTITKETVNL